MLGSEEEPVTMSVKGLLVEGLPNRLVPEVEPLLAALVAVLEAALVAVLLEILEPLSAPDVAKRPVAEEGEVPGGWETPVDSVLILCWRWSMERSSSSLLTEVESELVLG